MAGHNSNTPQQPLRLAFTPLHLVSPLADLFPATPGGRIRLTLTFDASGGDRQVRHYALTPELFRRAQAWRPERDPFGRRPINPDNLAKAQLAEWLGCNGGEVDRPDGPAVIRIWPNGTCIEEWRERGKYHRADGPAFIKSHADGSHTEAWFHHGQRCREKEAALRLRRQFEQTAADIISDTDTPGSELDELANALKRRVACKERERSREGVQTRRTGPYCSPVRVF